MSDKEFENYLTLLGSMLRLSRGQKSEISQELRDYLEDRFSELIEAGYSSEQARAKALEELGDAAKVANLFQLVSVQNHRRWIMKYASVSIFGCFLLLVMFASMWPSSSRIQALAPSSAQQDKKPEAKKPKPEPKPVKKVAATPKPIPKKVSISSPRLSRHERLGRVMKNTDPKEANLLTEAKLRVYKVYQHRVDVTITCEQFYRELEDRYGLKVLVLQSAIDIGFDQSSSEIGLSEGMRLNQALSLSLNVTGGEELDYGIVDGFIYIGTPDDPAINGIRIYDLSEVLSIEGTTKDSIEKAIVELVYSGVPVEDQPKVTWVGNQLVLRQLGTQHLATRNLIKSLFPSFESKKEKGFKEIIAIETLKRMPE